MLSLRQVSFARGTKVLLNQASVTLFAKQKIGLIGHNGCGKSSLFALLRGQLTVDHGEIQLQSGVKIAHLEQEIPDSDAKALDFVLGGDESYQAMQIKLQDAERRGDHATVLACHNELSHTGGYSKPAQAAVIMAGLGFSAADQEAKVSSFSGGWQMRLALARCLMNPADLFLLDEPTNHLDMEAIFWLERWLRQSPATILTISHDREFLDAFTSHTLHLDQQSLTLYTGNYSTFEKTRAEQLALQQAQYEKQQVKIKHLMSFVNRFKAKASKAKQAQSRVKAIERMELIAQAQSDSPFSFEFAPCPRAGKPLLACQDLDAGYQPGQAILRHCQLRINPGDRLALLGPNGQGKSTLIKTLISTLPPLQGSIESSPNLQIGYYAQNQLDDLDLEQSPLQTIQALSPEIREQQIRDFLGGFAFSGEMATAGIRHFSGGEKARLALAKLIWQRPNLLLLDEPTNHLDMEMRAALEIALQGYEGALVIISHDRHLLKTTVDDFYLVYQQKVEPFKGDLDDYHVWLQNRETEKPKAVKQEAANQYKDKKPLQNRLKKLEQLINDQQQALKTIEISLADTALYEASHKAQLTTLLDKQHVAQKRLNELEEEWLELIEILEAP